MEVAGKVVSPSMLLPAEDFLEEEACQAAPGAPAPANPGSSPHFCQPGWLGYKVAVASGQSWSDLSSSFKCTMVSPRGTAGRPAKASAGGTGEGWRAPGWPWRGTSPPQATLISPSIKEITPSIVELGMAPQRAS